MDGLAARLERCDALVNNAAIWRFTPLAATPIDEASRVLAVNVLGPLLLMQRLVPVMARGGGGTIVNVSSITAKYSPTGAGVYPASKAALEALTRVAAVEFGPLGIRCNAVGPGIIPTEGTLSHYGDEATRQRRGRTLPAGRYGEPGDVANVVAFFCSDDSRYVTGQVVYVDGGYTAAGADFFRLARDAEARDPEARLSVRFLAVTGGHRVDLDAFTGMLAGICAERGWVFAHAVQPAAQDWLGPEHRGVFDAVLCYDLPGLALRRGTAPRPVPPAPEVARRLADLLEAGQGFVFLHHALAGWPAWPGWAEVLGGRYHYAPACCAAGAGPIRASGTRGTPRGCADPDHPVCAGVADFELSDELYCCPVFAADVVPLLRADAPDGPFRETYHEVLGTPRSGPPWAAPGGQRPHRLGQVRRAQPRRLPAARGRAGHVRPPRLPPPGRQRRGVGVVRGRARLGGAAPHASNPARLERD